MVTAVTAVTAERVVCKHRRFENPQELGSLRSFFLLVHSQLEIAGKELVGLEYVVPT